MLRVELIIGFVVAGLAMKVIPFSFWKALFISGHGFWSALENAIIGPFLAFISFVCSVGNVPLAAALWGAGITFGGVIAFIFADLISFPLVMIYRKYYGNKVALKLTLLFWFVMSVSGLITEGIFTLLRAVPAQHNMVMGSKHFGVNATTILNAIALILALAIYYFYKNPPVSVSNEFAQDPICGMQVRTSDAPASLLHDGVMYYFCMQGCKESFISKQPSKA
jgi:YHS domain-containing protein